MRTFVSIIIFFTLVFSEASFAINIPSKPTNYVTDLASVIPEDLEKRINSLLKDLENKTSAQIFILTINSLEGQSIEGFSIEAAEKWKPGQKGKDNGVLITVALKERTYRIEVGYGLEGILPDSLVGTLARELLIANFKTGQYGRGLYEITKEIALIISSSQGIEINELKGKKRLITEGTNKTATLTDYFFLLIFVIVFIYLLIKHPEILLMVLMSSSRGSGSWSSGGGFGGGGGGGFGGGGASGRW